MTAALLTTATLTGGVLCSTQPLPTDGLPGGCVEDCVCGEPDGYWVAWPVKVGVVEEVATCGACGHKWSGEWWKNAPLCDYHASGRCDPWDDPVQAVTTLVEVTGPSHHAEDCTYSPGDPMGNYAGPLCHPDAAPDGWHTPVRVVERLDTPEPVDVPTELRCVHCHRAPDAAPTIHADARCSAKSTGHDTWRVPAVWWVPA